MPHVYHEAKGSTLAKNQSLADASLLHRLYRCVPLSFYWRGRNRKIHLTDCTRTITSGKYPVLFTVGFLISFVRERLGGVLMVLSVVSFHGIPWLYDKKMPNHWEYWWLLIPAMLFLFFSIIAQKQRKKRRYQRKNFDEVVNNNP